MELFSINATVLHDLVLVESAVRNHGYGGTAYTEGRLQIIHGFSAVQRVGAPNPCVVQGSTVIATIM